MKGVMAPRDVACQGCGTVFVTTSSQARYCSDACRLSGCRRSWRDYGRRNNAQRRTYRAALYDRDPEAVIARTRAYHGTEAGQTARRVADLNARAKADPVKIEARRAVRNALRRGEITRQPCEDCSAQRAQAHHDDYSKPLAVRWLCARCHGREHRLERRRAAHA